MKTLLTIYLLISTLFGIKESQFVSRFERFAENMVEKHEKFTEEEWESNIAKYREFRLNYKEIMNELSEEQRNRVEGLMHKVNAVIIHNKAAGIFGSVEDIVKEAAGTLRELKELIE